MKLLGISGSLRNASSNSILLHAAALAATAIDGIEFELARGLSELPLFNPDLQDEPPPSVTRWQAELAQADGFVISTPEYAHGLPGALKNGFDWVVRSGEFSEKPFALLNASSRSTYAQSQAILVLSTMDGKHLASADVTIHLLGKSSDQSPLQVEDVLHSEQNHSLLVGLFEAFKTWDAQR